MLPGLERNRALRMFAAALPAAFAKSDRLRHGRRRTRKDGMSEQNSDKAPAICVGEVLIEFRRGGDGRFAPSCGGDTFNTAIYLARAGIEVAFATAVGDDPYSDSILALAAAEGISSSLMMRVPGRLPGLCLVENGPGGERSIRYWREGAPVDALFELPDWMRLAEALVAAKLIYFSGITLSLFSSTGIGRFLAVLEVARRQGAKVAFDGNFRPRGWKGDLPRTRTVFIETLKRVDIALPTFDDEAVLWGDPSPESTVARLQAFGIGEIVVKNGPNSALVATAGAQEFVPVPEVVVPVDATAAGDGFNAGYLAARLSGDAPAQAASAAHRLAGNVIRHPGALVPRAEIAVH
jgi:2-dehydro-3-deoxygluconokinase